jgi:hypothetical protein
VIIALGHNLNMSSLPTKLEFPKEEEAICDKWAKESTFKNQNRLSEERGDEVCLCTWISTSWNHFNFLFACE